MKLKSFFLPLLLLLLSFSILSPKLAFADNYTLSGNVSDSSSNPIPNVTIKVNDPNSDSTTTDNSGNYSLSVPAGTYTVQAIPTESSGFQSATSSAVVSGNTTVNFVLVQNQSVITLSGQIKDSNGNPISGLQIQTNDGQTTTDSNGNYSVAVTPGSSVPIEFTNDPGSSSLQFPFITSFNIAATANTTFNVTIPVNTVTFNVQDSNNNPVDNADIQVREDNGNPVASTFTTSQGAINANISILNSFFYANATDNSGNATGTFITGGQYAVQVNPNNSNDSNYSSDITISSNTTIPITVQNNSVPTLSGQIKDSNGNPISGLQIQTNDGQTTTDSNGNYSVAVTPGSSVPIEFTNDPGSSSLQFPFITSFNIAATANTTFNVTIPVNTVTFHVQDSNNNPVDNADIQVREDNGNPVASTFTTSQGAINANISILNSFFYANATDNSGNATGTFITGGQYAVQVNPNNSNDSNYSSDITISSNTTIPITVQNNSVPTLSGQIKDSNGNPISGLQIQTNDGQTTTDSNGNYSVAVTPGSSVPIEFTNDPGSSSLQFPFITSFNIAATANTTFNVTIPVNTVTFHVQDSNNNPVDNADIQVREDNGNPVASTFTTSQGAINANISILNSFFYANATDNSGNATGTFITGGQYAVQVSPNNDNYSTINSDITISSNTTEVYSLQYNHNPPVTTATLTTQYNDGTYSDPTTVTLAATAAAGYTIANTYYTIDNGSETTYTTPFTLTGSGSHTIKYWSVDNSGEIEATNTKTFTISEAYTLSGTVYVDSNQNGFQDQREPGYAGATITVTQNNQTIASTTTDSNGNYSFSNLEAGNYTENLTLPSGYVATTTNPISLPLESNTTENFGIVQPTSLAFAVNAGESTAGNYVADTDYSGGSTYSTSASIDTSGVSNPAPDAVYQSVRYGNFSYTIPNLTANGTYTVQLQFSEPYWGTSQADGGGVGSRVFNVSVNGTQELSDFDVYAAAGGANKAVMEQIPATADSNGNITITFSSVVDNAMVSGIAVYNGTLPSPTPFPTPTPVSYEAISAGGQGSGNYVADTDYLGGTTYSTSESIDTSNVTNPAPQAVYQSVRYGNFSYTIPTYSPNTNYTVRLHFSEPYWQSAGSRLFNVSINGTQVLNNFDVYQTAGGENTAVTEQFNTTSDSNGFINIQFNSVVDNAMVSGIEITQQ